MSDEVLTVEEKVEMATTMHRKAIAPMTPLQEVFEQQMELTRLNKRIKELKEEIECGMAHLASKDITEDAGYFIHETTKESFVLDPVKFLELYPEDYLSLSTIGITNARKFLELKTGGKKSAEAAMMQFCTIKTSTTREIVEKLGV